MFELNRNKKAILGDIAIGLGILALAFMLKDADAQSKTSGMITILAAVLIRLSGLNSICRKSKNETKCNRN